MNTKKLLYEMTNIDSLNTAREEMLLNSNFLTWPCLRQVVPFNLRTHPPTCSAVLDFEILKCRDYYRFFIKCKYEKPKKWAKLGEEFDLEDHYIAEDFLWPIKVSSELYLRSFPYKVLNSILISFLKQIIFQGLTQFLLSRYYRN